MNGIIGDSTYQTPVFGGRKVDIQEQNTQNVILVQTNQTTPSNGMILAPGINYNGAYYDTSPVTSYSLGVQPLTNLKLVNLTAFTFDISTSWVQLEGFFTDPTTQDRTWDIYCTIGEFNSNVFWLISQGLLPTNSKYFTPFSCVTLGKLMWKQSAGAFYFETVSRSIDLLSPIVRASNAQGEIFTPATPGITQDKVDRLKDGCVLACVVSYDLTQAPFLENAVIDNAKIRLTATFGIKYKGVLTTN